MKKKLAMLMIVILVSYVFHSCLDYDLPKQIELEVEGSINLPINTRTVNWGAIVAKYLEKAFSENVEGEEEVKDRVKNIEVYNVNYGQDEQVFCVYIPIDISDSLNPGDHLPDIDALTKNGTKDDPLKIDETVEMPSFNDFAFSYSVDEPIPGLSSPPLVSSFKIPDNFEIKIPYDLPPTLLPVSVGESDFLHAKIKEGYFTVDLDLSSEGNVILTKDQFDFEYYINISQEPDSYSGLGYPFPSDTPDQLSAVRSLKDQHINTEDIKIGGYVTLKPKTGGGYVTIKNPDGDNKVKGPLKIEMNFTKFSEMDWDFRNIAKEMKAAPYSLAPAAKYLNWIEFDRCGVDEVTGEAISGIGIKINFTEIIEGLRMSVESNDDLKFDDIEHKPIHTGNNVFGNNVALKDALKLDLTKYKDEEKQLKFEISLLPYDTGDPDVLHLTDLEVGKALRIKGEANFFQYWIKAEVNMTEALRADDIDGDAYIGTYPDKDKNEPPIDYLEKAKEFIKGFKFKPDVIQTSVYLSGPDETIRSIEAFHPRLSLMAQYNIDGDSFEEKTLIERQNEDLTLAKDNIVLKKNPKFIDSKGRYYRRNLPDGGNPVKELVTIINTLSKLRFEYNVKLPSTIIVEPYMFKEEDEAVPHEISATIIMLIHMELTAGDEEELTGGGKGGLIKYSDMFSKDQIDLLGRNPDKNDPSKPEQDSMFTSLNVGYINFAIDFAGTFFTGGSLYIEKYEKDEEGNVKYKPILFPRGIPVNGSKIGVNITNNNFNIFKNNFINPDFRVEFRSGSTITIPKRMGLTRFTIEAKGKNTLTLDF